VEYHRKGFEEYVSEGIVALTVGLAIWFVWTLILGPLIRQKKEKKP
jgi:hypothetical protein